jgi:cell division protein FtsL
MILTKKIFIVAGPVQLLLIFFYIYTQSICIRLTYSLQDAEYTLQELQKRKKELTHELLQNQEAQHLKKYATKELSMKKIRITDIQEMAHDK